MPRSTTKEGIKESIAKFDKLTYEKLQKVDPKIEEEVVSEEIQQQEFNDYANLLDKFFTEDYYIDYINYLNNRYIASEKTPLTYEDIPEFVLPMFSKFILFLTYCSAMKYEITKSLVEDYFPYNKKTKKPYEFIVKFIKRVARNAKEAISLPNLNKLDYYQVILKLLEDQYKSDGPEHHTIFTDYFVGTLYKYKSLRPLFSDVFMDTVQAMSDDRELDYIDLSKGIGVERRSYASSESEASRRSYASSESEGSSRTRELFRQDTIRRRQEEEDEEEDEEEEDLVDQGAGIVRDFLHDYFEGDIVPYLRDVTDKDINDDIDEDVKHLYSDFLYILFSYQWIDIEAISSSDALDKFVYRIFRRDVKPKELAIQSKVLKLIKMLLSNIKEFVRVEITNNLQDVIITIARSVRMSEWFLGFFYDKFISLNEYFEQQLTPSIKLFMKTFNKGGYVPNLRKYEIDYSLSDVRSDRSVRTSYSVSGSEGSSTRSMTTVSGSRREENERDRRLFEELRQMGSEELRKPSSVSSVSSISSYGDTNVKILQDNSIDFFKMLLSLKGKDVVKGSITIIVKMYAQDDAFFQCFDTFFRYLIKNTYLYCFKDMKVKSFFKYPSIKSMNKDAKNELVDSGLDIIFPVLDDNLRIRNKSNSVNKLITELVSGNEGSLWRQYFVIVADNHLPDLVPIHDM